MYCDPEQHKDHLCFKKEKGKSGSHPPITAFQCGYCGAKAKAVDNVCEPVELSELRWMADGSDCD